MSDGHYVVLAAGGQRYKNLCEVHRVKAPGIWHLGKVYTLKRKKPYWAVIRNGVDVGHEESKSVALHRISNWEEFNDDAAG